MRHFKDFGIKPASKSFVGDKIKIERVLNREIIIHDFKIEDSKYERGCKKCLHLQISIADTKHVVFTGSAVLMELIEKVPEDYFPFSTTIKKENDRFEFT